MAEQSLPIHKVLWTAKGIEDPKVRSTKLMTKLNLGLPDDSKSKPKEPLHLIINTNGHKSVGKNLYQRQLRIMRRTLQ
jgi:hypothetical protein